MAYDSTGNRSAQSKSSPSSLSNGNPFEMPTYQLHFRSIFGLLASASAFNLMVGQVASGCGTGHVDVNYMFARQSEQSKDIYSGWGSVPLVNGIYNV